MFVIAKKKSRTAGVKNLWKTYTLNFFGSVIQSWVIPSHKQRVQPFHSGANPRIRKIESGF